MELKPCPLCGLEVVYTLNHSIGCNNCGIYLANGPLPARRGGLVESWNTRSNPASILGAQGGRANKGIPKPKSAENGKKGGRPKGSKNKTKTPDNR